MKTDELMALSDKYIMATYRRFPIVLVRGSGARVWDSNGKEYLDFVAGIAVCSLGHSHPKVVEAIKKQVEILTHVSNLYYSEPQIRFARMLVENSFADKVFFCNSGAEANEAAIKLARKYAYENMAGGKYELITMIDSFHGRTLATVTATGQTKFQIGFSPLPEGFKYIPFNDIPALEDAISDKTCGIMLEPIQGEGGIKIPDDQYLNKVRKICDDRGILMILDEVQVGMGRTGALFAYEHHKIKPDIVTLAKAVGNGFPVGVMMTSDRIASAFQPGNHASTFGGNPLAMAASLATMENILNHGILENVIKVGEYFLKRLHELKSRYTAIKDIRGRGLIIGMELTIEGAGIVKECMDKGLLINCTGGNVLRFVPPLVITEKDVDVAVDVLGEVIGNK
ncbi:MAG: aspartate aminotransferase family protein [Deltaproteobacteria bacterium]|nr:aspartate aminotransferase family protein [Deltaproteobacteria bacterium]